LLKECILIISTLLGPANPPNTDPLFEERVDVCSMLWFEAFKQKVPVDVALAVAWHESNLTNAGTNSSGCSGPMQIKIKYWCPNVKGIWSPVRADGKLSNCDLYKRGIFALKYYLNKYKNLDDALCGYGWGRCTDRARKTYVKQTLKYKRKIKKILERVENED
tara:strand:+ start:667 stop:1155 length:489 start_codon:yes stop_codon:yes gene_type:complete